MGALRNSFAGGLILLGALLCFPASLALWEQRTLAREDQFVELGKEIFDEPDVQAGIAHAIGDQVRSLAGVKAGQSKLKVSLDDIVLEAVKALAGSDAADAALRGTYHVSRLLADLDKDTVQRQGDDLVIDLKPTVARVVEKLGEQDPALDGIVLPEGIGTITIANAGKAGIALDAWRATDKAAPVLTWLPLVPLVLAFVIASSRGVALFVIGALIAGGAALRIFLLEGPVRGVVEDLITGDSVYGDAGFAVYGRIVSSFVQQDIVVLIGGLVVVAVGFGLSVVLARR